MHTGIELNCGFCAKTFTGKKAEITRQQRKGRSEFFCCQSCAAHASNLARKSIPVLKICQQCASSFASTTSVKAAQFFCSRSCASKGSVTEYRRQRAREIGKLNAYAVTSPDSHAKALASREGWKYVELAVWLICQDIDHKFEYPVDCWVFDLALPKLKVFVEFDGKYHENAQQKELDTAKDRSAQFIGWRVIRVNCEAAKIIPASIISSVLNEMIKLKEIT